MSHVEPDKLRSSKTTGSLSAVVPPPRETKGASGEENSALIPRGSRYHDGTRLILTAPARIPPSRTFYTALSRPASEKGPGKCEPTIHLPGRRPCRLFPRTCVTASTALHDGDDNVRRTAAEALAAFESPAARSQLVHALHSENVATRVNSAMAMGFMHDTQGVEALSGVLDDIKEDSKVQCSAAWALYQIGSTRAIDRLSSYLMKTLKGNDPMAIYTALVLLKDKQRKLNRTPFSGPLISLLGNEGKSGASREWVLPALKDITGQDFGADADQWLAWWERSSSATNESR